LNIWLPGLRSLQVSFADLAAVHARAREAERADPVVRQAGPGGAPESRASSRRAELTLDRPDRSSFSVQGKGSPRLPAPTSV
jgi:hypothetical protein